MGICGLWVCERIKGCRYEFLICIKGRDIVFVSVPGRFGKAIPDSISEKSPGHAFCSRTVRQKIAGYQDGYERDADEVMEEIASLSPDIVLVALGVPAQELLILNSFTNPQPTYTHEALCAKNQPPPLYDRGQNSFNVLNLKKFYIRT